jgi:hypothetical protein
MCRRARYATELSATLLGRPPTQMRESATSVRRIPRRPVFRPSSCVPRPWPAGRGFFTVERWPGPGCTAVLRRARRNRELALHAIHTTRSETVYLASSKERLPHSASGLVNAMVAGGRRGQWASAPTCSIGLPAVSSMPPSPHPTRRPVQAADIGSPDGSQIVTAARRTDDGWQG